MRLDLLSFDACDAKRWPSHGIDSLNCTLASLCETAALALGPSPKGVFTALIPCLPMFFSTWETYHTHTLYLGYFNGPTGIAARLRSSICAHIKQRDLYSPVLS